jgi:hypothetical protein
MYYTFLLNLWIMGRLSSLQLQNAVVKSYITQEEASMIEATPQAV